MTDAILNSKISLAKAKGIRVVADAHIPVRLRSSEIDLCCILGNLFDNAIADEQIAHLTHVLRSARYQLRPAEGVEEETEDDDHAERDQDGYLGEAKLK